MKFQDTICAPATVPGTGAISVIRVSGPDTFAVVDRVISLKRGTAAESRGYSAHFGTVSDQGEMVDEVIVSVFRAPHSYTGEDSVEISCHASAYVVQRILELLSAAGARLAEPGEFTRRAYVNGKMDLAQAEAVADVIASSSQAAHRVAMNQLRGKYSDKLHELRDELLQLTALMELELDFSEEDVEFADRSRLRALVDDAIAHTSRLADSFRDGNAIRNGVPVAIVGAANSGKSTLLNCLLGEERAIVSDIAGTTRDTIEETMVLDGVLYRFIDTAGLRDTADTIEKIGIDRAYRKLSEADIVLALIDATTAPQCARESLADIASRINPDQTLIVVRNKIDLGGAVASAAAVGEAVPVASEVESGDSAAAGACAAREGCAVGDRAADCVSAAATVAISALTGKGVDALRNAITRSQAGRYSASEILVTNARHHEALRHACESLTLVRKGLETDLSGDFISQDLREALYHLGSITGEISTDEVLGEIFQHFCIGK